MPAGRKKTSDNSEKPVIRTYYRDDPNKKLPEPILTEGQLDETIAERRHRRFEQAKREAIKGLGEVPMLLLLFMVSIAAGALSSLWIAYHFDLAVRTGVNLPPFLFMGRTFIIGFFSSCIAISTFLVCIIALIAYDKASKINAEDGIDKKKHI